MMIDSLVRGKGKWYKTIDEYRIELNLSWEQLKKIDRPSIKKLVRNYDTEKWKEGMIKKSVLRIYVLERKEIGYEYCYRNNSYSRFFSKS